MIGAPPTNWCHPTYIKEIYLRNPFVPSNHIFISAIWSRPWLYQVYVGQIVGSNRSHTQPSLSSHTQPTHFGVGIFQWCLWLCRNSIGPHRMLNNHPYHIKQSQILGSKMTRSTYCGTCAPPLTLHPSNRQQNKSTPYYIHSRVFAWVSHTTERNVLRQNDTRHTLLVYGAQIFTQHQMWLPTISHCSCMYNLLKLANSWALATRIYHSSIPSPNQL